MNNCSLFMFSIVQNESPSQSEEAYQIIYIQIQQTPTEQKAGGNRTPMPYVGSSKHLKSFISKSLCHRKRIEERYQSLQALRTQVLLSFLWPLWTVESLGTGKPIDTPRAPLVLLPEPGTDAPSHVLTPVSLRKKTNTEVFNQTKSNTRES